MHEGGGVPTDRKADASTAPALETEHLVLRPLSADDAGALQRVSNEPDVRRHLWDDEPVGEATIRDLIARSASMFSEEGLGLFGVRIRGRDDLLGFCGFFRLGGTAEPELCYELTREAWGKGLATEASRACLRYAFEEVRLERAIAGADPPNAASLRVIEKLGMRPLGNLKPNAPDETYYFLRPADFVAGAPRKERNMRAEARLEEIGLVLPEPTKVPPGLVLPFSWVRVRGSRAYVSGHGPLNPDGSLAQPLGKVGAEVSEEEAYGAARLTALAMLASLKRELGDLDRVGAWLRVFGMVNSAPGFVRQSNVINGFSDLILELYGPEAGDHARSAVGMAELPLGMPVEIEAEVELRGT
jgi:RimJ/RimL family protein N-acetyltransferase